MHSTRYGRQRRQPRCCSYNQQQQIAALPTQPWQCAEVAGCSNVAGCTSGLSAKSKPHKHQHWNQFEGQHTIQPAHAAWTQPHNGRLHCVFLCDCNNDKAGSTLRSSRAVPHPSTNRALRRLTSEVRRDPVHSTQYGRQRQPCRHTCLGGRAQTCTTGGLPRPGKGWHAAVL